MKTAIVAMLLATAIVSPSSAANCPYDAVQKEAIREAIGVILCVLDHETASRVLANEQLKTRAQDLHPNNSPRQWEYIYANGGMK